jgi:hypothetical protein
MISVFRRARLALVEANPPFGSLCALFVCVNLVHSVFVR